MKIQNPHFSANLGILVKEEGLRLTPNGPQKVNSSQGSAPEVFVYWDPKAEAEDKIPYLAYKKAGVKAFKQAL